jgi:3'(2'), 5'-bisphosphate nucleotidase
MFAESIGFKAVQLASRLCESVRAGKNEQPKVWSVDKFDGSPVSVADFGAQAVVCRVIRDAFPNDAIVGEEDSGLLRETRGRELLSVVTGFVRAQLGGVSEGEVCEYIDHGNGDTAGRYWTLDPIDGTKGFLRDGQYAIALALIENGAVQLGFLACPNLPYDGGRGAIFAAQRGKGSHGYTLVGQPLGRLSVRSVSDISLARIIESVESAHTDRTLSADFKRAAGITAEPVLMDSQAKYAAVARGDADIYLRSVNERTPDYRENIWDHAPGALIVEQAGGLVTDAYGRELDWNQGRRLLRNVGVLATNRRLHETVIKYLEPLLPPLSISS